MFPRFLYVSAGVLALLWFAGMPGQLYAQRGHGGFHPGAAHQVRRFSPGIDRRFDARFSGFSPAFDRRFFGGFSAGFDRRFFGGFSPAFDRRFFGGFSPGFDRRFFDPRMR